MFTFTTSSNLSSSNSSRSTTVEDEARRGVEVTVGKARLVVPPRSGDAKVADEATVVEDAAIEKADAKVVEEDNALVAMAGLLELFGKSDSLSLSILFTYTRKF